MVCNRSLQVRTLPEVRSRHSAFRCTQNPTMGEEWRRGWHPENIAPGTSESTVLVHCPEPAVFG